MNSKHIHLAKKLLHLFFKSDLLAFIGITKNETKFQWHYNNKDCFSLKYLWIYWCCLIHGGQS